MKYEKGSFIVVPNIQHLAGIPAITQTIYIWICSYANERGKCFPSHKTLAKDSGTSTATIERHIEALIKLGLLRKEPRIVGGRQTSNTYQILIKDSFVMTGGHQSDDGEGVHSDEAELNPVLTQPTYISEIGISQSYKIEKEPIPGKKLDRVIPLPYSPENTYRTWRVSPKRYLRILGWYLARKELWESMKTEGRLSAVLVRHKKAAVKIAEGDWSSRELDAAYDRIMSNPKIESEWTLDTVEKYLLK